MRAVLVDVPSATEVDLMSDSSYSHVLIPTGKAPNLTQKVLEGLERDTNTFAFFDDGAGLAGLEDEVRLIVCGADESNRTDAIAKVKELQEGEAQEKSWEQNKSWEQDKSGQSQDKQKSWEDPKKASWEDKNKKDDWKDSSQKWDDKKQEKKDDKSWGSKDKDEWKQQE